MKKLLTILFVMTAVSGWCVGSSTVDFGASLVKTGNPKLSVSADVSTRKPAAITNATFTTVLVDNYSGWDGVSSYTVPVSGYYQVTYSWFCYMDSAGTIMEHRLYKNGALVQTRELYHQTLQGVADSMSHSVGPILFSKGDVISVSIGFNGGSPNIVCGNLGIVYLP